MAKHSTTLDKAVAVANGLSPLDKVRLMEHLASLLEDDLSSGIDQIPESGSPAPLSRRMTLQELADWLNTHPPEEPWGDLQDNEDAAAYVHRMRRQSTVWLYDPRENE
jgi:hypothetical protein